MRWIQYLTSPIDIGYWGIKIKIEIYWRFRLILVATKFMLKDAVRTAGSQSIYGDNNFYLNCS